MKKNCPFCNGNNIIKIVYGFPISELEEQESKGLIHLGGCYVSPFDYKYHCRDCNNNFNKKYYLEFEFIDKVVIDINNEELILIQKDENRLYIKRNLLNVKVNVNFMKLMNHLVNVYNLLDLKELYQDNLSKVVDGELIKIFIYLIN